MRFTWGQLKWKVNLKLFIKFLKKEMESCSFKNWTQNFSDFTVVYIEIFFENKSLSLGSEVKPFTGRRMQMAGGKVKLLSVSGKNGQVMALFWCVFEHFLFRVTS